MKISRNLRRLAGCIWALAVAVGVTAVDAGQGGTPGGQAVASRPGQGIRVDARRGPVDLGVRDPALVGAIDVHAHLDPDSPGTGEVVRGYDVMKFAKITESRALPVYSVPSAQRTM